MKLCLAGFLVLSGWGILSMGGVRAGAQATAVAPAAKGADRFAGEPLVIVRNDQVIDMAADGTGVRTRTVEARVQDESVLKQLGVLSLPFAGSSEHVEWVYARVRHGDGTVTETPVENAMEIADPVTQEAPFYSDLKQMQLPIRNLRLGDTLEWQAKIVRTKPEAPGEFWGQESFIVGGVVLSETFELRVPKSKYVQVWSPKVKPVESEAGDERVYRWTWEQLKPTVGPEAAAAKDAEKKKVWTPEQEVDAREGKLPDLAWTTFKSWDAVGAWYRGLELERTVPDADVKAKVAQLTVGKTTQQEKVQAVYGYVATQIRYIGVSFGIGRFQPHSAGDVLANQYGDCKDKHTLLASMLQVLGLQPDAVLIGTGVRFNEAVPSPASFNHLITRVQVDGKPVWLDSTAEVAPYGMLLYPNRDHEALAIPPTGEAKVERTPAMPPFPMYEHMESVGTLDADGTSESKLTITSRGDDEIIFRSVLRQLSPAQYDLMVQRMCAGMGYGGTASHPEASKPDDTSGPVTISFDYKRSKAGDWPNLRTIPQLSPVLLPRPDEKDPPVQELELGVPRVESSKSAMKLPDGWGAVLPEAIHQKSQWATYDQTYKFEKGTVYSERRIEVLQQRVEVKDWKEYAKFTEAVDLGNEPYIQLVRHDKGDSQTISLSVAGVSSGAHLPEPPPAPAMREAHGLVTMAAYSVQARNFSDAQKELDKAKEINPEEQGLWSAYGYLALEQGKTDEGIADYKKELTLHKEEYAAYEGLSDAQWKLNHADAEQTLRDWIAADPASTRAPLRLGQDLLEDGHPGDAAAVAEAALAKTPEGEKKDEALEVLLGRAQLRSGEKENGRETLVAVLKSSEDTGVMNDASYELADAGLELPLAASSVRTALSRMEDESKAWTLNDDPWMLGRKTQLIQATWDTMGWILFREGKFTDAKGYIGAAWRGNPSLTIGEHLAEIEAAQGEKNAALTQCELALASARSGEDETKASALARKLRQAGAQSQEKDAKAALQKLDEMALAADGVKGTEEYQMFLSEGRIREVKGWGASWVRGADAKVLSAQVPFLMPPGSGATLVMRGRLSCQDAVCQLTLLH